MMPSYLTGAFRLVAVLRGELLIYHHYYLNIPGSLNYTRIKLGLSFSCNFSLFFSHFPHRSISPILSLAAQRAELVLVPASSSRQFPGAHTPRRQPLSLFAVYT